MSATCGKAAFLIVIVDIFVLESSRIVVEWMAEYSNIVFRLNGDQTNH